MTIRTKALIIFVILFAIIISIGSYIAWGLGRTSNYLEKDVPEVINNMADASYLDNIATLIRYDDEVLTQSARNYAFTGDVKWKERYNEFVTKLDLRIKQALEKGDEEDRQYFSEIDQANIALVEMETQAFTLVDEGKRNDAQAILDGTDYANQKSIYKNGLDKYLARRGLVADEAASNTEKILSETNVGVEKRISASGNILGIYLTINLILLGLLFYIIFYSVLKPLGKLKKASERISQGDLDQHLDIKSKDEIGLLAQTYNQMVADLKESRAGIEKKVAERTADLEKLNKYMTGRELKMIELKKKIADLEKKNDH